MASQFALRPFVFRCLSAISPTTSAQQDCTLRRFSERASGVAGCSFFIALMMAAMIGDSWVKRGVMPIDAMHAQSIICSLCLEKSSTSAVTTAWRFDTKSS
jgi:hypothetical protein